MHQEVDVPRPPRKGRTTRAIVEYLARTGGASRADISRELGHSASTVSSIVGELLDTGAIEEVADDAAVRGVGRPGTTVRLRIDGCLLGIEFDHRHVTVAVLDSDGVIVAIDTAEVTPAESARLAISGATDLATALLREAGFASTDVHGIGVAVPAPVNEATGMVGSGSLLPNWREENVYQLFADRYGRVPIFVDNDVNLAAVGERVRGAARSLDNFLFVKASMGLGGAICLGGEIYRGPHGAAGELGHVSVPGERIACWCGNIGCLETVSSVPALLRQVSVAFHSITDLEGIRAELRGGNRAITRTLFDMGTRLGLSVAQLCTVLDIDSVIIGGDLVELTDDYLRGAAETVRHWVHPQLVGAMTIVPSALHGRAGIWGALTMARRVAVPLLQRS